jgi:hypothetical protein
VCVVDQKYQVLQMYLMTMSTMNKWSVTLHRRLVNKWSVTLHRRLVNATVLIEEYRLESSPSKIQDTLLLGVTGKWVHVA